MAGVGAYELRAFEFNLEANAETERYKFIKPNSAGKGIVATSGRVSGVNMEHVPAGGTMTICKGILPVEASEAIAIGSDVSATTGGLAMVATAEVPGTDEVPGVDAIPAVPGVYTITVSAAAAVGDVITISDKTYTCASPGTGAGEFAAGEAAATGVALQALLDAETEGDAFAYTWTVDGAVITATEKAGGVGGKPTVTVVQAEVAGSLVAAADTTTKGALAVPAVPAVPATPATPASIVVGTAITASAAAGELLSVLLF